MSRLVVIAAVLLLPGCLERDLLVLALTQQEGHILGEPHADPDSPAGVTALYERMALLREQVGSSRVAALGVGNMIHGSPEAYLTQGEAVIDFAVLTGIVGMVLGPEDFGYPIGTFMSLSHYACEKNVPLLAVNMEIRVAPGRLPGCLYPGKIVQMGQEQILFTGVVEPSAVPVQDYSERVEVSPAAGTLLGRYLEAAHDIGVVIDRVVVGVVAPDGLDQAAVARSVIDSGHADVLIVATNVARLTKQTSADGKTQILLVPQDDSLAVVHSLRSHDNRIYNLTTQTTDSNLGPNLIAGELNRLRSRLETLTRDVLAFAEESIPLRSSVPMHSPVASLMADLAFDAVQEETEADTMLLPGRLFQDGLPEGKITTLSLVTALPSDPELTLVEVPGTVLQRLIESMLIESQGQAPVVVPSNTRLTLSASTGEPSLIQSQSMISGEPILAERDYRVLVPAAYLEPGGPFEGAYLLNVPSADQFSQSLSSLRRAIIEGLQRRPRLFAPDTPRLRQQLEGASS